MTKPDAASNPSTNAPIILFCGPSGSGKSTICEEIERQDRLSEKLGFETWGVDLEANNEMARCRDLLKDDARFSDIESKFPEVRKIVTGIYFGEIRDSETGIIFNLNDDKNLDDFLAQTNGRYDKEALKILKTWANEDPNHFKEVADLTSEGMESRAFERAVDHAIENSKNGIPTILDIVPNSKGDDMGAAFKKRLTEQNFTCPTLVALVHVPVAELIDRTVQRNIEAVAPGGNPNNKRMGTFMVEHCAALCRTSTKEDPHALEILSLDDIYRGVNALSNKNDVEDRDRESKKLLALFGFKDGETSIALVPREFDVVFKHSNTDSTAQIAEYIIGWVKEKMLEGQVRDPKEDIEPMDRSIAQEQPSATPAITGAVNLRSGELAQGNEGLVAQMVAQLDGKEINGGGRS